MYAAAPDDNWYKPINIFDMVELTITCPAFSEFLLTSSPQGAGSNLSFGGADYGGYLRFVRRVGVHAGITLYNLHRVLCYVCGYEERLCEQVLHLWSLPNAESYYANGEKFRKEARRRREKIYTDKTITLSSFLPPNLVPALWHNAWTGHWPLAPWPPWSPAAAEGTSYAFEYVLGGLPFLVTVTDLLKGRTAQQDLLWVPRLCEGSAGAPPPQAIFEHNLFGTLPHLARNPPFAQLAHFPGIGMEGGRPNINMTGGGLNITNMGSRPDGYPDGGYPTELDYSDAPNFLHKTNRHGCDRHGCDPPHRRSYPSPGSPAPATPGPYHSRGDFGANSSATRPSSHRSTTDDLQLATPEDMEPLTGASQNSLGADYQAVSLQRVHGPHAPAGVTLSQLMWCHARGLGGYRHTTRETTYGRDRGHIRGGPHTGETGTTYGRDRDHVRTETFVAGVALFRTVVERVGSRFRRCESRVVGNAIRKEFGGGTEEQANPDHSLAPRRECSIGAISAADKDFFLPPPVTTY
ncbi:hypothetical protein GNI_163340 [Gregarina niphandrodes]|uniref:Uncharacterized protein n=1 Tax=Gregarina niphandrodes TaxID=110365 RepID=A0A023AYB4_GRENI|nr:hypothetical protein GNI_163340 [Gregarina niphandrodes]EZG43657.1 hypothetical protein GNI_163340 [Gregarina niphandrodes]|eukprot:XP_011133111.1 hypothetical protein GNI_163340 [Gregarina niphandrodes]